MANKKYITQMLDQYLETVNEVASDDVIRARDRFHDSVDQYVAEVFEDAWKKGFAFAMQIRAGM